MRALCSGEDLLGGRIFPSWREWSGAFQGECLATDHFQPSSPDVAPWPVTPEHRSRRWWCARWIGRQRGSRVRKGKWLQDRTHPSRFERGPALLTLRPQRAGATMTDARGIQEPQGAIAFETSFLEIKRMVGRTPQRSIGLRRKGRTRKPMRKRGTSPLWRTICDWRGRCCRLFSLLS